MSYKAIVRNWKKNVSLYLFTSYFAYCYEIYMMRQAIWYHFYNLRNVKNTHGGVLLLD